MKNWKIQLNVVKEWNVLSALTDDEDDDFDLPREELIALTDKLREYSNQVLAKFNSNIQEEYLTLVMRIEDAVTIEDFDMEWQEFYDFCDLNNIWVNTLS